MIRLLGAITGSALALAALLVLVGVPQFKAQPSELEQVVVTLPLRAEPVDEALPLRAEPVDEALPDVVEEMVENAVEEVEHALARTPQPEPKPVLPEPEVQEPAAMLADIQALEEFPALQPDTQQWYAFWSPFRSEIAASGFVTQLQRVTGLDYRVVKTKPGVYEVAFAYANDGDILDNLSQISAATGLDMPGN